MEVYYTSVYRTGVTIAMKNEVENQTIGENIKLYRIKAGLTQKDLCRRIYVHQDVVIKPATIKAYEMGKCSVSAINLHRIAAALGVDSNEFHEDACPGILLDKNTFRLVEAYRTIKRQAYRDAILHIAHGLSR